VFGTWDDSDNYSRIKKSITRNIKKKKKKKKKKKNHFMVADYPQPNLWPKSIHIGLPPILASPVTKKTSPSDWLRNWLVCYGAQQCIKKKN